MAVSAADETGEAGGLAMRAIAAAFGKRPVDIRSFDLFPKAGHFLSPVVWAGGEGLGGRLMSKRQLEKWQNKTGHYLPFHLIRHRRIFPDNPPFIKRLR